MVIAIEHGIHNGKSLLACMTRWKLSILFWMRLTCTYQAAPAMLQFLQIVFGLRLPEAWVVVTAGNPFEYNNKEFDLATLDRLKN